MPSYIDLHTHTTASDGAMSPTQLVTFAKQSGIGAIAVTDHDTTAGLDEAMLAGESLGLEVIPGIELSADYPREMHILGLFIDPHSPSIAAALENLQEFRAERNQKMIDNLRRQGFDLTAEDVLHHKPGGTLSSLGRIHMALALVEKGYAKTVKEAFSQYLTGGSEAYVSRQKFSPRECLDLIHSAGGSAFLAHPIYSEKEADRLEALVAKLKHWGLDGIECLHSELDADFSELCFALCQRYGLMASGGSDFHGANKPHVKIGQACGGRYIESHLLDDIKRNIGLD